MALSSAFTSPQADVEGKTRRDRDFPFRVVLVMQGGGALGAYHGGVYQAMHENGLEPDWVVGTSIGAINGAIIAGNLCELRVERLRAFWKAIETAGPWDLIPPLFGRYAAKWAALATGVSGFFAPNPATALGWRMPVGVENASLYTTAPLARTLAKFIDFAEINSGAPRFTFGLVNVRRGRMQFFDNRETTIELSHVLATGALPPSFPAIRIDGEAYWDAGFYNNTPIEKVFDEKNIGDSIIFAPNLWVHGCGEPQSLEEVLNREKSIGFASRADDQAARQVQIHRLRHLVHHLLEHVPQEVREKLKGSRFAEDARESFVHLIKLNARGFESEGLFRDIDFTPSAIQERWQVGYEDTLRIIEQRPWDEPVSRINGVAVHNSEPHDPD